MNDNVISTLFLFHVSSVFRLKSIVQEVARNYRDNFHRYVLVLFVAVVQVLVLQNSSLFLRIKMQGQRPRTCWVIDDKCHLLENAYT